MKICATFTCGVPNCFISLSLHMIGQLYVVILLNLKLLVIRDPHTFHCQLYIFVYDAHIMPGEVNILIDDN